MKKILGSFFLLLLLILVSCNKDVEPETGPEPELVSTGSLPTDNVIDNDNEILLVSGNDSIFTMWVDGSNRIEISAKMIQEDSAPSFSPDGNEIVYGGSDGDIYLIDLSQSHSQNLTNSDALDKTPIISPDGKLIAYLNNTNGVFGLYLMNRDGSESKRLIDSPNDIAIGGWHPDSGKIVYVEFIFPTVMPEGVTVTPSYFIKTIDLDSQEIQILVQDGQAGLSKPTLPSYSPDGKKVVFQGIIQNNPNIFTIDEINNITQVTHDETYYYSNPFWNPEGTQIAVYVSPVEKDNEDSFLCLIDLDGNIITRFNDITGYVTSWIKLK